MVDLVDEVDEPADLGVVRIQVVVVDIQNGVRVGLASCLECDGDERLRVKVSGYKRKGGERRFTSPRTREKTLLRSEPSSLKISLEMRAECQVRL